MKKLIFLIGLCIATFNLNAQVGIGTNAPDASAMLDVTTTTKGILFPRMTSAQRQNIPGPAVGLYVFDTDTKSLWYYDGALWVNTVSEATFGDIKSGIQMADHAGWVKLDGRLLLLLSASQQGVAKTLLGPTISNLPNASSAYLSQNGEAIGSVTGDNTTTIAQDQLPNTTLETTSDGAHKHPIRVGSSFQGGSQIKAAEAQGWPENGSFAFRTTDRNDNTVTGTGSQLILNAGAHTHTTSSLNGGVPQQPITISPKTLSVNNFIYSGQSPLKNRVYY